VRPLVPSALQCDIYVMNQPPTYAADPHLAALLAVCAAAPVFRASEDDEPRIPDGDDKDQVGIATKTRTRPKKPSMFKVLMLNDDYTPMEFVIAVLQRFFSLDTEQATRIMLKVHNEGRGVCGVFPRDIAATKVEQVSAFARQHNHPLACVMEEN